MANEYATSAELKATLSLSSESFADADIALALTAASRAIDSVCDRRFWADADATQVRYYSPIDGRRVWTDDIVTLTSFQTDPGGDGTFEETWTLNTDFTLEPLNAAADGWPWTSVRVHPRTAFYLPITYPRSVKVTGKFGWSAVPDAVKQATKIVAAKLVMRARQAPFGVIAAGELPMRIASNDPDVQLLIGDYVRANHS